MPAPVGSIRLDSSIILIFIKGIDKIDKVVYPEVERVVVAMDMISPKD